MTLQIQPLYMENSIASDGLAAGRTLSYVTAPNDVVSKKTQATAEDWVPQARMGLKVPDAEVRELFTEYVELLLSSLRGSSLLIATLSYGLGIKVSQLRRIRLRDLSISDRTMSIAGKEREIPAALVDDLREYLHERLCGTEVSARCNRRNHELFPEEAFTAFIREYGRVNTLFSEKSGVFAGPVATSCVETRLRMLGWFHRRWAARRGIMVRSPIDLLDKGPRIVRRGHGGLIDAYYRWHALKPLF